MSYTIKLCLSTLFLVLSCQVPTDPIVPQIEFDTALIDNYENYKEKSLTHRRFKHSDILPLIEKLPFKKSVVGHSFEAREIYMLQIGAGEKRIMLWSQMHGDEPTATMALFDLMNWFAASGDEFDILRTKLLEQCSFFIIPMLNPDGAERYQRRTSLGIDMNRDALMLQNPESQLLKSLQDTYRPEFSFNLHDQSHRYSAGKSSQQASISFLATAHDEERQWSSHRIRAAQVISSMNQILQELIPGQVGRFNDDFEPRAFGDNISLWGSSLILVESGGHKDDPEKQYLRKLNFIALIQAFHSIVSDEHTQFDVDDYHNIPKNEKYLFDLLIRNVNFISHRGDSIKIDIGINIDEYPATHSNGFEKRSIIADVGDLSVFWGIEEIDADGMELKPLKDFTGLHTNQSLMDIGTNLNLFLNKPAYFVLAKEGKAMFFIKGGICLKI
jgi:hypothetical protein